MSTKQATSKKIVALSSFLKNHIIKKDSDKRSTNTRIGDEESGIYGGNYHVPDEEYESFMKMIYKDVIKKKTPEYLTETQMDTGPMLVDIDIRHDLSIVSRQYSELNIGELVNGYLDIFKNIYQFDDDTEIQFYILEKQTINPVEKKRYTKDGIHIIISLHCDHITQQLIREKIIANMDDIWDREELGITNDWDSVFDKGISTGKTNWQMFGCQKPNHQPYQLTQIYNAQYNSSINDFNISCDGPESFDYAKDIFKLSARYPHHYEPFMQSEFINECEEFKQSFQKTKKTSVSNIHNNVVAPIQFNILDITCKEDLDNQLKIYIDMASKSMDKYHCFEAYSYIMTLPQQYYGSGSYDKWFAVACALRNTSNCLFIVWVAFSAQSSTFDYDISNMWDMWQKLDVRTNGLTLRSIIFWSKRDAPEKYNEIRMQSIHYYIDRSIDSGLTESAICDKKRVGITDYDIALVLYQLKKGNYTCASIKNNQWYEFTNHRWVQIDSGYSLKMVISTELRKLYNSKAEQVSLDMANLGEEEDKKREYLKNRVEKIMEIYTKLAKTNDKKNFMIESRDMFYDRDFMDSIDQNQYLLCCTNGVWDFKEKVFRAGKPEDYLSKCTNIEYNPIGPEHTNTVDEINDFMTKLFPVTELREYMWNHLASTLLGTPGNQTFNNYLGGGRNGKSVLVTLMSKVLGQYKADLPLTAIVTPKRTSVGGLAPEIAALKGARYVVMQEPKQGDIINEGILKQLVSGLDPVQARIPYHEAPVNFYPQFKLVVCTNILPEIKAQDHGTWRRIRVVPYMSLFTEKPVQGDPYKPYQYELDSKIDEKFDSWKTVFLSMLVERVLTTGGNVPDCETVLKASNEYKMKQDVISQFIHEKIIKEEGSGYLKKSNVNAEFSIWHQSNVGTRGPQSRELHEALDRLYGAHDKMGWRNLKIIYDNDQDDDICGDEIDDPF